jgi:RNA polymerase sigma-70 factor, ECF subfamily
METDSTLLSAARMMNKDALVKIFDLYSTALYNYALRLTGDPLLADQIVGDVFAKLLDQLASGQGPREHLRSYLYETTYHRIIDETRYSQRRVPLEAITLLPQNVHSTFPSLEEKVTFEQILYAIQNNLTADQRHVIILRFIEGFSLRETATILGKGINHIKVIQNRAIAALRNALKYNEIRKAVPYPKIENVSNALNV